MWGMKAAVLVLLLVLGSSSSSGRFIEDTSERRDEPEETEDFRNTEDDEEEGTYGDEEREANDEQENGDAHQREEVVRIPGQSSEERAAQEEDEDNSEDDRQNDEFEDEGEEDDLQDDRMMDSDEGGMSLAGREEEDMADEGGVESFRRKVEEISKANENIQAEISKLNMEFDKALTSDSKPDEGAPDISVESKSAMQRDASSIYSSDINKASEDTADDLKRTGVQHKAYSDDGLVRQYSEIGEDANIAPDEDY
ncbi:hypothetical protein OS493_005554 [Desmophyllum pertusum]|uniref:Uncharacterized protein n=1 Tax=Desmophyllum pertusum TaxID=174260 RepID=A0A9W9YSG1_9CNID|nr:hypothetical protein OS493_005554 [Desmophyllum pertusum]